MYSKKLVKVFLGLHKSVTGHLFMWTQIACIFLCAFPAWNRAFRTARGHLGHTIHTRPHPPHTKKLAVT